ncbi:hypothetical protein TNCV_1734411 [Trichonephila clavipes]|nr:hypothetical protein TNCV_1734411 [Trichonephila clavipes]
MQRCGTLAEREELFWSQSCWFLETISERLFRMVRLNLSTMPSDCGCKGVVLVLSIPSSSQTPLQYRRDEISSLIGMKLKSTISRYPVLHYSLRYGGGFLIRNGVHFRGPFREVVNDNK